MPEFDQFPIEEDALREVSAPAAHLWGAQIPRYRKDLSLREATLKLGFVKSPATGLSRGSARRRPASKACNTGISAAGRSLDTLHMNATPAVGFERVFRCIQ